MDEISGRLHCAFPIKIKSSKHRVGARRTDINLKIIKSRIEVEFSLPQKRYSGIPHEIVIHITILILSVQFSFICGTNQHENARTYFPYLIHRTVYPFNIIRIANVISDSIASVSTFGIIPHIESLQLELLIVSRAKP
jgi:hypothetical protein